jgi:hypothetical protein
MKRTLYREWMLRLQMFLAAGERPARRQPRPSRSRFA